MRRCFTQVVVAVALSFPLPALADGSKCPPGAWFCAEADVQVPSAAPQQPRQAPPAIPAQAPPPPQVEEPSDAPPPPVRRQAPQGGPPPPVVVYQPVPNAPPPQVIVVTPGYGYGYPPPTYYTYARPRPPVIAPPAQPRWHSEFGLSLRAEGIALGKPAGANFNAGLGGVGLSLRYRPTPHFAFDLGVDLLAGTDYNGFRRTEVPVSLGGIIFFNPRSRVQVYMIGGANFSRAQVRSDQPAPQLAQVDNGNGYGATYTYFGGQGGLGLEFRVSRHVAVDLDGLGFVRTRVGDTPTPEFIDPQTGKTTNTSGGGIFRGALTFWW